MPLRFLVSPSGGLTYHLIARRRARSLWAPFRAAVRSWLSEWFASTETRSLIVFGPSAGWTLPLDEFARFSQVIFVEPDPVARLLLRTRLPRSVRASFLSRADLLPWTGKPGAFAAFLNSHPEAAILFTNVLGQIPLVSRAPETERARDVFLESLRGRAWASYHDLYSGSSEGASHVASRDPQRVFSAGDVIDHETAWLANEKRSEVALWPLTERSLHIIEFVRS